MQSPVAMSQRAVTTAHCSTALHRRMHLCVVGSQSCRGPQSTSIAQATHAC
jgi:hypothetical protein